MQNIPMTEELIERIQKAESHTMSMLVYMYSNALHKATFKYSLSESDSSELVQSVWTTFYEGAHKFQAKSHIKTYLHGILRNKVKELYRERKKHTSSKEFLPEEFELLIRQHRQDEALSLEQKLYNKEIYSSIKKCIQKLPRKQQIAFSLKEIDGLGPDDICKQLNINSNHLGVLLHRAKLKLQSCIKADYPLIET